MTKILNWTFGACFRTLGRFLAIFLVGVLLIFIGSKIGIELPDWLALKVSAAAFNENWADGMPNLMAVAYKDCSQTSTINGEIVCSKEIEVHTNSLYTGSGTREFVSTDTAFTIGSNGYVIDFTNPVIARTGYVYNINVFTCSNKSYHTATTDVYFGQSGQKNNTNIKVSTNLINIWSQPGLSNDVNFVVCSRVSSLVVPDRNNQGYINLKMTSSVPITGFYPSIIALEVRELGLYSGELKNIVDESGFATAESVEEVQQSVDMIQQEIQQTQDTITNDDTTGAQDYADGFFNDFQSEDFGLSSIVTAPLRGINAMLTDTCIAPSATYKGQTFSLPCGSILWSRPGGDDFKSFINVMYGGFLAYLVIRKFFLDVENLKNPNSDKVEVDKL